MSGSFRFARLLAPKFVVGGLCAAATATSLAGAPIPPCSPDGVCLPKYETWGWYETRWRTFPGDSDVGQPTPPEKAGTDAQPEDNLTGPSLPEATKEGQVGPQKKPGARGGSSSTLPSGEGALPGGAPGGEVPGGTATEPATEGDVPPGAEGILPPIPGVTPSAEAAPDEAAPGAAPETPPSVIDPFGSAPPTPPAWMVEQTNYEPLPEEGGTLPLPGRAPSIQDSPNMQGDDAPPALPAGLQSLFGAVSGQPVGIPTAGQSVALTQPVNVRPMAPAAANRGGSRAGVVQTSAEMPLGIQLINPASAVATQPGVDGLQQAIYFEASDQKGAVALPPVQPAN